MGTAPAGFLKFENPSVEGSSMVRDYRDWIEVLSFNFSGSSSGSMMVGSGLATGKVSMQDFSFMCLTDKSTPTLAQLAAEGKYIKNSRFVVVRQGEQSGDLVRYYEFKFYDNLITSLNFSGASGGDTAPPLQCSFQFVKFEL